MSSCQVLRDIGLNNPRDKDKIHKILNFVIELRRRSMHLTSMWVISSLCSLVLEDGSEELDELRSELIFESSVSSYYTRHLDLGLRCCEFLTLPSDLRFNEKVRSKSISNIVHYTTKLNYERTIDLNIPDKILDPHGVEYLPCNPSLTRYPGGYVCILRLVNYRVNSKGVFTYSTDRVVRTKNFLLKLDNEFNIISSHEIINRSNTKLWDYVVKGMEDCRCILLDKTILFTCTTAETNPKGTREISVCKITEIEESDEGSKAYVDVLAPIRGPTSKPRHEKNWVAIEGSATWARNGEIKFSMIYSFDPLCVVDVCIGDKIHRSFRQLRPGSLDRAGFRIRGGSPLIEWKGAYLTVVHDVTQGERRYIHKLLELDSNLNLIRMSKPFFFESIGIEFCLSLTLCNDNKKLIIGAGIEDKRARLYIIPAPVVEDMLRPVPNSRDLIKEISETRF